MVILMGMWDLAYALRPGVWKVLGALVVLGIVLAHLGYFVFRAPAPPPVPYSQMSTRKVAGP